MSPQTQSNLIQRTEIIRAKLFKTLEESLLTQDFIIKEKEANAKFIVKTIIDKYIDAYLKNIDSILQDNANEIIAAVVNLSVPDLALMAKNLVEMTSFKRRVSLDLETVGGPIDVAVISKGDGFIWIERKHYFKRELNEHFFEGYKDR